VLDSLTITVTAAPPDFPAVLAFYDATLRALGFQRLQELVDEEEDEPVVEAVGWGPADGTSLVWVVAGPVATTGLHVRLEAHSPSEVETFYAAGLESGGRTFGAPRRWPIYRRGEFNAIVQDPQGNLVEAVAPE
jgi:catechol 2,3-dioxygenase-like lactoylglutathione lyase family enzyme